MIEEVKYLVRNSRNELYNLSSQMIDVFIKDIFSKNRADLDKAKVNLSNEQRETLKQTVTQLKAQVEEFVFDQNASKTVTEKTETTTNERLSPLREMLSTRKGMSVEAEDIENKND